jgi:hypothetical protein
MLGVGSRFGSGPAQQLPSQLDHEGLLAHLAEERELQRRRKQYAGPFVDRFPQIASRLLDFAQLTQGSPVMGTSGPCF